MAYRYMESFGWAGTDTTIFQSRYNTVLAGLGLQTTGGRFGNGPRGQVNNSGRQDFNFPGAPTATIRLGTAFQVQDGATMGSGNPLVAFLDANTIQCYITINTATRLLELRRGDNTLLATAGSTPVQNASWYYLEVICTLSNTVGQVSVQLDGVAVITTAANLDNVNSAAVQCTGIRIQGGNSGSGLNLYCDMFCADDVAAFQGESRVTLLTPAADGAASAWTPSTGTTLFNLVDEIPPNGDTDYISSATAGQQALFTFSNLTYTPATVFAVQTSLYARKDDAAARSIAGLVRSGGTTTAGTTYNLTTSYLDIYLDMWALNPTTAAAWTAAEVDGMEAGVQCIA